MAFRPFGKDVGPAMSSKPSPFTPFGASTPTQTTSGSPIQPPASQNQSANAGQSYGPGGIQSGFPIQQAPPPSAFQTPPPSFGQPLRPGGVQSNPSPVNQTPPPLVLQNPPPSSGQPYRPGGIQRSPEAVNGITWGSGAFPRPSPSVRPYQFPGAQRPTLNSQFGHDDGSRNFLKDHGEHSLATPPASTLHTLSRNGINSVEIGRSQDSKRKRSLMPFSLGGCHLCQQALSSLSYPWLS